jgi:hypothetical protein
VTGSISGPFADVLPALFVRVDRDRRRADAATDASITRRLADGKTLRTQSDA